MHKYRYNFQIRKYFFCFRQKFHVIFLLNDRRHSFIVLTLTGKNERQRKILFPQQILMLKNFYWNINVYLIQNDILLNASHNIFGIIYRIKENVHQNIRALFAYLRRKMSLKWENFTWSHFDVTDLLNSWMICMIVNLQFATQFFFAYENIQFANDILIVQDIIFIYFCNVLYIIENKFKQYSHQICSKTFYCSCCCGWEYC